VATVLLVDDDELVRRVVAEALETAGHRVLTAPDALTALAIDEPFDVAIVDVHLGNHRCSPLGEELRRRHRGLGVIAMTGLPDGGCHPFADAVLAKPFALLELFAAVERLTAH
jgi:two-component system cell cycle response regulator CpdR